MLEKGNYKVDWEIQNLKAHKGKQATQNGLYVKLHLQLTCNACQCFLIISFMKMFGSLRY